MQPCFSSNNGTKSHEHNDIHHLFLKFFLSSPKFLKWQGHVLKAFVEGHWTLQLKLWNDFCRNIRKCCYTTSFSVWLNVSCCVSPYFSFDHHHQSFHSSVEVVGCHLKDCVKLVKGVCVGLFVCVCAMSLVMYCANGFSGLAVTRFSQSIQDMKTDC